VIDRTVTTVIDVERCTGCGLCVAACPWKTISMIGGKAAITGDRSLSCGHCAAVCPAEAITVRGNDPDVERYGTFAVDSRWLPPGDFDTTQLVRLMASRRSCRRFQARPVERPLLEDLVRIGVTAPSGSNSQVWTFTILPDRAAVEAFGDRVSRFFRSLNRLAENSLLRNALKLIGKRELSDYYRGSHRSVSEALDDREKTGRDRLFHGATAAIIVGTEPGGSTPEEDALLAAQNILLAAHAMGLGSCLIGFAVASLKKDINVKRFLGIPDDERVHAVIALGYPDETYLRPAGRKGYLQRTFEAPLSSCEGPRV
jgi:nitroreductase/NAD-dependent dihydropyrimidine dehydrogenase PreA subunit